MQKHANALEQKASLRALIETVESSDYNVRVSFDRPADDSADESVVDSKCKRRRSLDWGRPLLSCLIVHEALAFSPSYDTTFRFISTIIT